MSMQHNQTLFTYDPRNLEIKTKSVEHTLLPLVTQISTLVNFKENIITGNRPKSERALRAALKIGNAVEAAVERFVVVGETISDHSAQRSMLPNFRARQNLVRMALSMVNFQANNTDENPDIQPEMYDACQEARVAGASIANLHSSMIDEGGHSTIGIDKSQLIKAARRLLSSVTRVLLLADRVLVKHILRAEDKIVYSLTKLENTMNFTEFVKIFTEFGGQMVDLAHRSGDRQNDLKSEKRQAQMWVSRSCLERLTMLLLTASKTLLRHPEDLAARQCRNTSKEHIVTVEHRYKATPGTLATAVLYQEFTELITAVENSEVISVLLHVAANEILQNIAQLYLLNVPFNVAR